MNIYKSILRKLNFFKFFTKAENKVFYLILAFFIFILGLFSINVNAFDLGSFLSKEISKLGQNEKPANKDYSQLYSKNQLASSNFLNCPEHFPNNRVISVDGYPPYMAMTALCSDEFAVMYSGASKTPLMVFEKLNSTKISKTGKLKRTNDFYQDTRLKREHRAVLDDYKSSGYDRGHLAPAGDMTTERAMAQSFALSNMVPQNPENNRKVWNKIESDVRKYAKRAKGDVFVITGALYQDNKKLKNRISVPTHLYKVVYDAVKNQSWVYFVPNAPTDNLTPISYNEFVNLTGLQILENFL